MSDVRLRDLAIGRHSDDCIHRVRSSSDPKILESTFVVCLWPHLAFRALGVLTVPYLRNNVVRRQSLQSFGSHRSTQLDMFYNAIKTREHRSSRVLSFAVAGVFSATRFGYFYRYVSDILCRRGSPATLDVNPCTMPEGFVKKKKK